MENNIEKLIEQQEEEFSEKFCWKPYTELEELHMTRGVFLESEIPQEILAWHKSSIKQILEALVAREDKEIQKIKISENTELQEVWNSAKQDTISYLKQQIKLLE